MGLNRHDASAACVCNRRMAIRCMAIGRMHGALSYSGNIHPHRAPRPCPIHLTSASALPLHQSATGALSSHARSFRMASCTPCSS